VPGGRDGGDLLDTAAGRRTWRRCSGVRDCEGTAVFRLTERRGAEKFAVALALFRGHRHGVVRLERER
jgi:hypothetical protein